MLASQTEKVSLPNNWRARPYQAELMRYMFGDGSLNGKRADCVWHRRAGKDSCCLQVAAIGSQVRVGTIWHMLPTLNQGRKVIWNGVDGDGRRMIDQAFPSGMVEGRNDTEMLIRFKNGSYYQVVGSDNYNSLVGANPVGVIFSEYSVADPAAWDYIRPILAENGGWALFIYTFRGRNHGWKLFEVAKKNPKWFVSLKTVDDTTREDGTPVISPDVVQAEREAGMSNELIQQEFYCSPDGGLEGAFYTESLKIARAGGRIGNYPYDPTKRAQTWWDIGIRDATAIIVTQRHESGKPIIVDYFEERNVPLDLWAKKLGSTQYNFEEHWGPHDLEHRDWTSGKTRREYALSLGIDFEVVPKIPVQDGIEQAQALIRTCYFDEGASERLLDALASYRREWDPHMMKFRDRPLHDWASNGADSFRTLAVGWRDQSWLKSVGRTFKVIRAAGGAIRARS
jgi:hypothetical protein